MRRKFLFIVVGVFAVYACQNSSSIETYYYECYSFNSPSDSSFFAYRMDYVENVQSEDVVRVFSLRNNEEHTWMVPGCLHAKKVDKGVWLRNCDGVLSPFLRVDTYSPVVWAQPVSASVHKYIGPITLNIGDKSSDGYEFEEYRYLYLDRQSYIPTPFRVLLDENMSLYYSKTPSVEDLNVPLGMDDTYPDECFSKENWSFVFNPIVSYIRVDESMIPQRVKRAFRKECRTLKNRVEYPYQ